MYGVTVQYPAHTKYFEGQDYALSDDNMILTLKTDSGLTIIYLPSTEAVTITNEDH